MSLVFVVLCYIYAKIITLRLSDLFLHKDPAPGLSGVLQPQEKDLIQALIHHLLLREAEREADLDLHLLIVKKGERDHGHLKGLGFCRIRMVVLLNVKVLGKENV